jgi:uracil-DNA glycosylase
MPLTKEEYSKYLDWDEKYSDYKVKLSYVYIDRSWKEIFDKLSNDSRFKYIESELSRELKESYGKCLIYPKPDCLFRTFSYMSLDEVRVVFIGQDPYFNHEILDNKKIPQAMGLCFSVPVGFKQPSSLDNIYKCLVKHKHVDSMPKTGNLEFWAHQGCLMLNTALTVKEKEVKCHYKIWKWFSDELIKYISLKTKNVVFVLWGGDAFTKINLIDQDKHEVVVSSHPSGLSANKPMREFPAFNKMDHFSVINKKLIRLKNKPVIWKL